MDQNINPTISTRNTADKLPSHVALNSNDYRCSILLYLAGGLRTYFSKLCLMRVFIVVQIPV